MADPLLDWIFCRIVSGLTKPSFRFRQIVIILEASNSSHAHIACPTF